MCLWVTPHSPCPSHRFSRSGTCVQTFYGHNNAVNGVAFSLAGDTIASCDADGIVKLWDVRVVTDKASLDCGDNPVNKVRGSLWLQWLQMSGAPCPD